MTKVIKRDGTIVDFDRSKIEAAISKAYKEIYADADIDDYSVIIRTTTNKVMRELSYVLDNTNLSIDVIQNIVEKELMSVDKNVAKAYITYRYRRDLIRNKNKDIMEGVAEKIYASNVQNQNANVDEYSFGGRIGEAASFVNKQFALDYCMCEKSKNHHLNNEIYEHDLDSFAVGSHNCLSVPIDKLLAKGFKLRQVDIRPAQSVNTACQLVAVLFQIQSLQQFGGVSATHLDHSLVPYIRKSFRKHYMLSYIKDTNEFQELNLLDMLFDTYRDEAGIERNKFDDWIEEHKEVFYEKTKLSDDDFKLSNKSNLNAKYYQSALFDTIIETIQAVEGLYHNLNSLQSRSGNQLPFSSINYGTCTSIEGRLAIKAILDCSIKGVGKFHKTSIFPCGIFQCMKGVNRKPGEPNYDLFRLALKSTSLRLYPNYCNVDWSGNTGYDKNDPKTYFSTMGALDGNEHLYIKINDSIPIDTTIQDLFNYCKTNILEHSRPASIFYNKQRIHLEGDRYTQLKSDVVPGSGVYAITYLPEDITYYGSSKDVNRRLHEHKSSIILTGGLDSGICFNDTNFNNYKFEVVEYTDDYKNREKYYIENCANINFKGIQQKYYKVKTHTKSVYVRPNFRQDKTIPQDFIDISTMDIKVLDSNNKWTKINHIFKNDKHNTPLMMHIYYQEYDKIYCLSCTEDHPLWTGEHFVRADNLKVGDKLFRADNLPLTITNISWHWCPVDSYDIGTATGSFIGSDIIMHNCRTANGWDINGFGQLKDGRGNICPVSIILPTIAMQAKEIAYRTEDNVVECFMQHLSNMIDDAKDMLLERFEWICSQSPKSASFMYENGTMEGYVPEEGIRSALKHGTLAIGQLGLAETLQLLIGTDHTNECGMKLAKRIEQLFKDKCIEFKNKYKLNFGVYFTPAETLCYTAMKKFKEKYDIIKDVSDKDYFTNSMHVPVWKELTPFQKIDIESELTGYSSAGCITYVELPESARNNIDALETIVNYAMDKDIPYFAINVPNDTCNNCGYTNEISSVCPKCGSEDIKRLRRVTGLSN